MKNKIMDLDTAKTLVESWKKDHQKIVFTNGCFDLLHAGHVAYLSEAAGLGDKLIIGLNSDSSVKKLKGESRPINDDLTRSTLLASMSFVDAVVFFSEETPFKLISTLLPDILVKGGDYSIDGIIGAKEVIANGGDVKSLSFLPGYSSTSIIEKIKNT
nr:D-glycero-beta-D-manno-heptose 1-phosphate adenylyltransferase [uncultured Pedobacter sp.]